MLDVIDGIRRELSAQSRGAEAQTDALERIAKLAHVWFVLTWIHIALAVLLLVVYFIAR
ncbi:hypothetical protein ACI8AF_14395 [Blastococcus sp. SYSU D00669]